MSCLGYVTYSGEVDVRKDPDDLHIVLYENSLALDEVVVTAQKAKDGLSTSHSLGRDALNHLQLSSTTDVAALLPGGKTVNPDLTSENSFSLRQGGASTGNAAFGTAVEVDGVRLGNNASFGNMGGTDTRSVAVENIESIEVITGVPSAEYGDLNSGMVKINTRKGRTPVNVTFSVNPRTYQTSVSKGFDLQEDNGVLNVSAEWARSVKKLISPYQSYSRTGVSLTYSNTFAKVLRLEAGVTGNIGGMDTKDDPDAFTGEYQRERDDVFRANTSLTWMLNRSWITNLKLDASVNFNDNIYRYHKVRFIQDTNSQKKLLFYEAHHRPTIIFGKSFVAQSVSCSLLFKNLHVLCVESADENYRAGAHARSIAFHVCKKNVAVDVGNNVVECIILAQSLGSAQTYLNVGCSVKGNIFERILIGKLINVYGNNILCAMLARKNSQQGSAAAHVKHAFSLHIFAQNGA